MSNVNRPTKVGVWKPTNALHAAAAVVWRAGVKDPRRLELSRALVFAEDMREGWKKLGAEGCIDHYRARVWNGEYDYEGATQRLSDSELLDVIAGRILRSLLDPLDEYQSSPSLIPSAHKEKYLELAKMAKALICVIEEDKRVRDRVESLHNMIEPTEFEKVLFKRLCDLDLVRKSVEPSESKMIQLGLAAIDFLPNTVRILELIQQRVSEIALEGPLSPRPNDANAARSYYIKCAMNSLECHIRKSLSETAIVLTVIAPAATIAFGDTVDGTNVRKIASGMRRRSASGTR